jgi:hypothetical protein
MDKARERLLDWLLLFGFALFVLASIRIFQWLGPSGLDSLPRPSSAEQASSSLVPPLGTSRGAGDTQIPLSIETTATNAATATRVDPIPDLSALPVVPPTVRIDPSVAPSAAALARATGMSDPAPWASPTVDRSLRIVLEEDFAGNRRRWPDLPRVARILNSSYLLTPPEPGQFVAIGAPIMDLPRDAIVSARFRKVGGPPGGGYGLIVRDQEPDRRDGLNQGGRFYVLAVGDRGDFGVWLRDRDRFVALLPWTPSGAIRRDDAVNNLTAIAVGQQLTFLVNGIWVASLEDLTLSGSGVGLYAGGDFNRVVVESFAVRALN